MAVSARDDRAGGIGRALGQVADGLGRLVSEHLALAKLELATDARELGTEIGKMLVFAPMVIVGYALLCSALSIGLMKWMALPAALVVVGGINFALGSLGLYGAIRRVRAHQPMQDTLREVGLSASRIAPALDGRSLEAKGGN
jgi:hypothetical protein